MFNSTADRVFRGLVAAGLAAVAMAAYAGSCPVDGGSLRFTGNTRTVSGVLLKECKCAQGHTSWAKDC